MPPPEREREAGRGCGLAAGRRGLCSRPARRGLAVKIRDAHLQDLGQVQKNEVACGIKKPDSDLRHRSRRPGLLPSGEAGEGGGRGGRKTPFGVVAE